MEQKLVVFNIMEKQEAIKQLANGTGVTLFCTPQGKRPTTIERIWANSVFSVLEKSEQVQIWKRRPISFYSLTKSQCCAAVRSHALWERKRQEPESTASSLTKNPNRFRFNVFTPLLNRSAAQQCATRSRALGFGKPSQINLRFCRCKLKYGCVTCFYSLTKSQRCAAVRSPVQLCAALFSHAQQCAKPSLIVFVDVNLNMAAFGSIDKNHEQMLKVMPPTVPAPSSSQARPTAARNLISDA